jgi:NADPH-dependent 2,4-dienoyl-CoA reductase/sulfur reductase-like enzyme
MHRVVVVGASLAGVHAAEALREFGFGGEVTLLGAEADLPYDRPPLSKDALRCGTDKTAALLRPASWYEEKGVDLRLGVAGRGLDLSDRAVLLDGGERLRYDGLVLATGSAARVFDAHAAATVHVLRTARDSARLHASLKRGRHLVVIGAGFIGLEVAATARELGLDVSVVEVAPVPLARVLGDEVGTWFLNHHAAHGVEVHCNTAVDAIEPSGSGSKVRLRDGTVLAADVVVAGIGAAPAVSWLRESGLRLADGVACDAYLRASAPGVVAAGDVARWYNPLFDEDLRIEQWTNAVEQGRYAAQSLLGIANEPYAAAPYFWSDQFTAKMRFVGTANAAESVHVEQADDRSLIALFGRDELLRGALCINAPRKLAIYRDAIVNKVPWHDVVAA